MKKLTSVYRVKWLRNKVFLHSGPFFMQGHSTCTDYTSNYEILNLFILQMKMSPLIVNPKKEGCYMFWLSSTPVNAAVVKRLLRHKKVCGKQWECELWAFPFLPNLKNRFCLFVCFLAYSSMGHLRYLLLPAVEIFKCYSCSLKEVQELMSRIRLEFCFIANKLIF